MRKIVAYILVNLLFTVACKQNNTIMNNSDKTSIKVPLPYFIDIEEGFERNKSVPLSTIGKELDYIPLETTHKSVIGDITHIGFSQNYIFVGASGRLLQFDREGKFIRQVGKKGRGPGEYIAVNAICIDERNERIFIYSWGVYEVLIYNFNGEFIKTLKAPWGSCQFIVYDTVGLVFHMYDIGSESPTFEDYNKNSLYFTDFELNEIFTVKKHLIRKGNTSIELAPLYYFNNVLRFKQFAVDTLYTLNGTNLVPYAIFNLGKSKIDPNLMYNQYTFEKLRKQIERGIEIKDIFEGENYIFTEITIGFSDSSRFCIFNKQTSETTILKDNGFINDLDGGLSFWPKYVYYKDSLFIDYCNSSDLLNYMHTLNQKETKEKVGESYGRLESVLNKLDIMSNPVLIILK